MPITSPEDYWAVFQGTWEEVSGSDTEHRSGVRVHKPDAVLEADEGMPSSAEPVAPSGAECLPIVHDTPLRNPCNRKNQVHKRTLLWAEPVRVPVTEDASQEWQGMTKKRTGDCLAKASPGLRRNGFMRSTVGTLHCDGGEGYGPPCKWPLVSEVAGPRVLV